MTQGSAGSSSDDRPRKKLCNGLGRLRSDLYDAARSSDLAMREVREFCSARIAEDRDLCVSYAGRGVVAAWEAFDRLDLIDSIRECVEGSRRNPGLDSLRLARLDVTLTMAELLEHEERWAVLTDIAGCWWRHPDHQDAWGLPGLRGWEQRTNELGLEDSALE